MKTQKTEETKRDYDNWLLAVNNNFPNKGFDITVEHKNDEFRINFTPRHSTPIVFCKEEYEVTLYLAAIYTTLNVLQTNDKI